MSIPSEDDLAEPFMSGMLVLRRLFNFLGAMSTRAILRGKGDEMEACAVSADTQLRYVKEKHGISARECSPMPGRTRERC